MLPKPAHTAPPTAISTTPYSLLLPSACSTAMWMGSPATRPRTLKIMFPWASAWLPWDMFYHIHNLQTKMPHITLDAQLPGIRGPMAFRPETAKPLNVLAEVLLRSENSLSRGDRELIATYVSSLNDCFFCQNAHGGIAQHYLQCDMPFIDAVKEDFETTPISAKLKALLVI